MTVRLTVEQLRRLQAARPKVQAKIKQKRVRLEDPIHIDIVDYLEDTLPLSWCVHHSRNGGKSKGENGRAKAMGAKRGWPDIEVMGNLNGQPFALFLEVKTPDGYVEPHQRDMHTKLRAMGFKVFVVRSVDDARAVVESLGLPIRKVKPCKPSPSLTRAPANT